MDSSAGDARPGRIGYVVNAFPVVSETFLLNELRALGERGVPVAVMALDPTQPPVRHAYMAELDLPVTRRPSGEAGRGGRIVLTHARLLAARPRAYLAGLAAALAAGLRRPARMGLDLARLRRRLRSFQRAVWLAGEARRLDVAHLHSFYADRPLAVTVLASRLCGLPYSFAAHAKDLYTTPDSRLRRALAGARFATVCHRHGEQRLRELAGVHAERVVHQRHGTDVALFRPDRSVAREAGLVLAVGRLTPKKGFDDLLQACALLRESTPGLRCVIIGDGRLRAELQADVVRLGLGETVSFRGFQPQQAVAEWYRRASLLVMPSRVLDDGNRDGIPNVVVEAMCASLPVIATSAGSIPEVIEHGVTGVLVPPGDPQQLAAAIAALLRDPQRANQLASAAARAALAMDFRQCVAPLAARFRTCLQLPAAASPGSPAAPARALADRPVESTPAPAPARDRQARAACQRSVEV